MCSKTTKDCEFKAFKKLLNIFLRLWVKSKTEITVLHDEWGVELNVLTLKL